MTQTISNIIELTNAPTPPRWFEFLLEPGKLQHHLETKGCDPSPTQLISLFFRNIPLIDNNEVGSPNSLNISNLSSTNGTSSPISIESFNDDSPKIAADLADKLLNDFESHDIHVPPDSYEAKYRAKKAYSLQILAIQVASFIKWDLDIICNNLSIPVQHKLVKAFNNACASKNCPQEVKKFADIIYYQWFLRSVITYQLSALQPQANNTTIIYLSQLQQQQQAADSSALLSMVELFVPSSKQLKACSSDLHSYIWNLTHNKDNSPKKLKGSIHPFRRAKLSMPTMHCFDTRDEQYNNWEKCDQIEPKAFIEAACYDLGRFFFFEESYDLAKESFEIIKESKERFPKLVEYFEAATLMLDKSHGERSAEGDASEVGNKIRANRSRTEKFLFDCMTQFSLSLKKDKENEVEEGEIQDDDEYEEDSDLRYEQHHQQRLPDNIAWYLQVPPLTQQQQLLEVNKGDVLMSQGNFKQAMGCFVGALMLMTDYFRFFSKNYIDEEPYISRMIQCSISLSCYTQAVALCQMTRCLNYTIAFKQLNERVCNDCCDDIYECIWNVTLLEYIINLHSKRGELERRTKVIQLIGQLELNENNPEDILKEAEHVRRGRFFRIMANKYL